MQVAGFEYTFSDGVNDELDELEFCGRKDGLNGSESLHSIGDSVVYSCRSQSFVSTSVNGTLSNAVSLIILRVGEGCLSRSEELASFDDPGMAGPGAAAKPSIP